MKIAIPVYQGRLSLHFGHSEEFELYEVGLHKKVIKGKMILLPPQHKPGSWPSWLCKKGVDLIIAGAMSIQAIILFKQEKIEVLLGAPSENVESIIMAYLKGILISDNITYHNKQNHQESMDV